MDKLLTLNKLKCSAKIKFKWHNAPILLNYFFPTVEDGPIRFIDVSRWFLFGTLVNPSTLKPFNRCSARLTFLALLSLPF